MSSQTVTPSRADMRKRLREQHAESVSRTQALYKEQRYIQQEICKIIRDTPKTVPDLAIAIGLPTHEVLWHLTALKKYGIVAESGMCGDYPLYRKVEEK
jgi:predicted transcriptional regulator